MIELVFFKLILSGTNVVSASIGQKHKETGFTLPETILFGLSREGLSKALIFLAVLKY